MAKTLSGGADKPAAIRSVKSLFSAPPLGGTSQVCDLGWLPRTRHVGNSGVKVRPRAYLSLGIAGAPEHLEGIRDAELIVACNTDPAAPIFTAAHYGTTLDAVELLTALIERVQRQG